MVKEEKGKPEEAYNLFLQAWNEATDDLEKFIAAHFVARHQKDVSDKLTWLETDLKFALTINDDTVKSAFLSLYFNIARCYEDLGDLHKAEKFHELAASVADELSGIGPFFHGTKADLHVGEFLTERLGKANA